MSTWTKEKLGNLADIIMGQSPESRYYNENGEGLPFFQGVKDFGEKYPTVAKWTTFANKVANEGDILFSVRAPVGDINVAKYKCALGRGVCAIRSKNEQSNFLYFLLTGNIKKITNLGNGAIYDSINKPTLENIELSVPDVKTQTIIGSVLSSYDDLIENNEKRIKALEEMAQLLYTEWFVKFKFPGHEKAKFIDSGTSFGKVPEGWKVNKLADVLQNVRNSTRAGEHLSSRQYVPIENIAKKSFILRDCTDWQEAQSSLILFDKGDILFGAMRPYFHKVAIAMQPGVTRTTCLVLKPKQSYLRSFSLMAVFSDRFVSFASSNTQGATIPYAVWENSLENYPILYPDSEILEEFENIISDVIADINSLARRNKNLSQIRDLLIPQLVTGKRELQK